MNLAKLQIQGQHKNQLYFYKQVMYNWEQKLFKKTLTKASN